MSGVFRRILVTIGLALIAYFLLSLVSIISQVAGFADRLLPGVALWVFWGLTVFFGALLLAPIYLYFRLPKPPIPPVGDDPVVMDEFLSRLRDHLKGNPRLSDMNLASNDEIPLALEKLGNEADEVVKRTASTVFVSTAVMQNGRLDALFVLASQLRLVWRIASIYYGRPSPRQMVYLYSNVGANVLIADNLQEIDFAEIATPIVAAIFPSIKGGIPGLQGVTTLLVNSLANGAANAFLTLRIGLVARSYCAALSIPEKSSVRRSSTVEALALVGDIVKEQGGRVVEKSWQMVRDTVVDAAGSAAQGVWGAGEAVVQGVKGAGEAVVQGVKGAGDAVVQGAKSAGEAARGVIRKNTDRFGI